jgi:hypothetical protein
VAGLGERGGSSVEVVSLGVWVGLERIRGLIGKRMVDRTWCVCYVRIKSGGWWSIFLDWLEVVVILSS